MSGAKQHSSIVIKNGLLYTLDGYGNNIKGDILLENGKISKIAASIPPPADAGVIDAAGQVVMPGIVEAHCHIGVSEDNLGFLYADDNECTEPVTPHMRAFDAINPRVATFADARRGGITTAATGPGSGNVIGGTFTVIKTAGTNIEQMAIKEPLAMKCAFGENPKRVYGGMEKSPTTRMGTAAVLREALFKAIDYQERKEAAGAGEEPKYDAVLEALLPVINGRIPLKSHCHRADDIITALRIKEEFGLEMTLDHCTEGHLTADQIAASGVAAIIGPTLGSEKWKFELYNMTFATPKILYEKGIKFAIMTDHPVIPIEYLPVCAGYAVKEGLPEIAALQAITRHAAEIIGVADRVGTLAVGKDADVVISNGLPLYARSVISHTLIDGRVVYRKNEQEGESEC